MKKEREEKYEAPLTKCTQVSLESGICGSSANVENPDDGESGQIEGHEVNTEFGGSWSNGGGWDSVN